MPVTLHTIGYERLLPEALVAELQRAGVERLIDVRERPQSRRPGMSKTKLAERLAAHGISYEHWRSLGTPADIRVHYRKGATARGAELYRDHLHAHAEEDLDLLLASLRSDPAPAALMCLEAEPAACHRRVICEALLERDPEVRIVEL